MAVKLNIYINHVKSAFLNGELKEPVYLSPHSLQKYSTGQICKLKKAIYGLRQSPKCYYVRLSQFLFNIHFERPRADLVYRLGI